MKGYGALWAAADLSGACLMRAILSLACLVQCSYPLLSDVYHIVAKDEFPSKRHSLCSGLQHRNRSQSDLYMAPDTSYNSQYKSRNEGYSSANHRASVIVKTKQWDACLIALASNKGVHNNNASTLLHSPCSAGYSPLTFLQH